jgi:flagellar L-ring protein precursor FlgH
MWRSLASLPLLAALALTGCWNSPNEFMREPIFSPVGAGLVSEETAAIQGPQALVPQPPAIGPPPSLYVEPRITHVGDIVTVIISINDKATLGSSTGRSQTTKDGVTMDYGLKNGTA